MRLHSRRVAKRGALPFHDPGPVERHGGGWYGSSGPIARYGICPRSRAAVDGDLDAAIRYLDDADVDHQKQIVNSGRWQAVQRAGFALEAGELDVAERHTAEAKPMTRRTPYGCWAPLRPRDPPG